MERMSEDVRKLIELRDYATSLTIDFLLRKKKRNAAACKKIVVAIEELIELRKIDEMER